MKLKLLFTALILTTANAGAVNTSLETSAEKYSYAIGINFAQSLMRQGAPLDADAVYMALRDALEGATPRMSADDMTAALRSEEQKAGERKRSRASENLAAGKAFMAQNKKMKPCLLQLILIGGI